MRATTSRMIYTSPKGRVQFLLSKIRSTKFILGQTGVKPKNQVVSTTTDKGYA